MFVYAEFEIINIRIRIVFIVYVFKRKTLLEIHLSRSSSDLFPQLPRYDVK